MSEQMQISHTPVESMEVDDQVVPQEQNLQNEIIETETSASSSTNSPPEDFILWVNDVPESAERFFEKTPVGQWFCLVLIPLIEKTSYETRLYMDEDHRDKVWLGPWYQIWEEARYIEKETWPTYGKAMTHIKARRFKLQKDLRGEKVHNRIRKMPKDCAEFPHRYLNKGDHIQSTLIDGWIHHEGIYVGDDNVIHISPHSDGIAEAWSQKLESCCRTGKVFPNFADTPIAEIRVVVYRIRLRKRDDIVDTASFLAKQSFLDGDYHLIKKNCQHFASFCASGEEHMTDAPQLLVTGGIIAGIAGLIGFAAWFGKESAREQVRREQDRAREEQDRASVD